MLLRKTVFDCRKASLLALVVITQLFNFSSCAAAGDSLEFIRAVKEFAFAQTGFFPDGVFFDKWKEDNQPYNVLYISHPDSIKKPNEINDIFSMFGLSDTTADKLEDEYKARGFHTLYYKAYANSSAFLNSEFVSYSDDAIAFIIFHELLHRYIQKKYLMIPYEFNEALGDVIGNYGTLIFANETQMLAAKVAKRQIRSNERIYKCINKTIAQVDRLPSHSQKYHDKCQRRLSRLLRNANSFQKFRFGYKVNNAFLLRNQYYCKYYFLLKEVYLNQKSMMDFFAIIQKLSLIKSECIRILELYK